MQLDIKKNIEEKRECSGDHGIGGLVLANRDPDRKTINFFECRKYKYNENMQLDDPKVEVPTEENHVESCPVGSVLWALKSLDTEGEEIKRWENPRRMNGVCKVLKRWTVHHDECQEMTVTGGPWEGDQESGSNRWDNILYCPRNSLAVALTRRYVNNYYQVASLKCCFVTYP